MKEYDMILEAEGPVFVGDGNVYKKKDYIYDKVRGVVYIMDYYKMYSDLEEMGFYEKFRDFSMDEKGSLAQFFYENNIKYAQYKKWISYTLSGGDYLGKGKSQKYLNCFYKDPYGDPYIPGSSIKGMFRTILEAYEIMKNPLKYENIGREVYRNSSCKRRDLLSKEASELDTEIFHTLNRDRKRQGILNDFMSKMIVSDSKPLKASDLVICMKEDKSVKGVVNDDVCVLRECLKPGTKVRFKIKLKDGFPYSIEEIMEAVKLFGQAYYSMFSSAFGVKEPAENNVWIGGGAGFVSKTVLYPLLGKQRGMEAAVNIFYNNLPHKMAEKHKDDVKGGAAPHMIKYAAYEGRSYQMGLCRLKVV